MDVPTSIKLGWEMDGTWYEWGQESAPSYREVFLRSFRRMSRPRYYLHWCHVKAHRLWRKVRFRMWRHP